MTRILAFLIFVLVISAPCGLHAQGKHLNPGFGLHISPWVAPTNVPPKARSLQPRKAPKAPSLRSPFEFLPLQARDELAAIELRQQNRESPWLQGYFSKLQIPAVPCQPCPPSGLPDDFRSIKNSSIRPPPGL